MKLVQMRWRATVLYIFHGRQGSQYIVLKGRQPNSRRTCGLADDLDRLDIPAALGLACYYYPGMTGTKASSKAREFIVTCASNQSHRWRGDQISEWEKKVLDKKWSWVIAAEWQFQYKVDYILLYYWTKARLGGRRPAWTIGGALDETKRNVKKWNRTKRNGKKRPAT